MKHGLSKFSAFLVAAVIATGAAQANEIEHSGTPITAENLVDVLNIQRIIDAQVDAYDRQDWELARFYMTEEFETTVGQDGTGVMRTDDFLGRAQGYVANADHFLTQHTNSGYRIFFHDENNATAYARGAIIVMNSPAGEFADEGGTLRIERWNHYEYGVVRTDEGWKINKILITYNADNFTSLPPAN